MPLPNHLIPDPLPPGLEAWVERSLPGPLAASLAEADEGFVLRLDHFRHKENDRLVRVERVTDASLWVKGQRYSRETGRRHGANRDAWNRDPELRGVTEAEARRLLLERRHRELVAWASAQDWNEVPIDVLQRMADVVLRLRNDAAS